MAESDYRNYLQDETVLIQLILNEYLCTCRIFKSTLRVAKKELKKDQWSPQDISRIIGQIRPAVTALAGTSRRVLFPIPWKNKLGHLEKLEDYCYLLVLQSSNTTYFSLHQEIQEARVLAKQMMRFMQLWDCHSSFFPETFETKHILNTLEELCERIKNIAGELSVSLQFSVNNENVILFFLRNHQEITSCLGKRFIKQTLKQMFPYKTARIKQEIDNLLSSKGLDNLSQEMMLLIDKIKC